MKLADNGLDALRQDAGFAQGMNTWQGYITRKEIAAALDMEGRFKAF
jgi:alanine dehydrogenase